MLISLFDTSFRNCCDIHVSQLQFFLRRCALVFFSSTHFYFPLSSFFPHFIPLFPSLLSSDQHGFSPIALYCPVICEINIPYHIIWMKLKKCKARVVKLMNLQDVTWCSLVERYWSFETNLLSPSIFRVYIWRLSSKSYDVTVPEDDGFSCQNCFHQQLFCRCFHVKYFFVSQITFYKSWYFVSGTRKNYTKQWVVIFHRLCCTSIWNRSLFFLVCTFYVRNFQRNKITFCPSVCFLFLDKYFQFCKKLLPCNPI